MSVYTSWVTIDIWRIQNFYTTQSVDQSDRHLSSTSGH